MIYSRFGNTIKSVRYATLQDVRRFEGGRKPDGLARQAVRDKPWVVVEFSDGKQDISHLAYLRADGGLGEILDAIPGADRD